MIRMLYGNFEELMDLNKSKIFGTACNRNFKYSDKSISLMKQFIVCYDKYPRSYTIWNTISAKLRLNFIRVIMNWSQFEII